MERTYKIIRARCAGEEVIIKKSRFLSDACPVHSPEEASAFIDDRRKRYYDAKHHCFAYICGNNGNLTRCSDDGEPSGTAGRPILDVISGFEIQDIVIVVTRYFGGTLLGTGGLVKAYTEAARSVLNAADIITITHGIKIRMSADYTSFGKIKYELENESIDIRNITYDTVVSFTIIVTEDRENNIVSSITDITGGRIKILDRSEGDFEL